ncbi:MAG: L-serine ammonia-lyase, iron-sulfur-dependent, subunit alpha [Prevotellaceae bacterium]|jgi:L-serine dehydratase|nr:L-serine ammonia-lyase, iron-sulfur-dependent, subunit alpha [Prevotellaceae bacterium]
MESIKELYKIGHGPSSSHTMGPKNAAIRFVKEYPNAQSFRVTLYGSLAATGKGHLTDKVIGEVFALHQKQLELIWEPQTFLPPHPNGLVFEAIDSSGVIIKKWTTYSIGGGDLSDTGKREPKAEKYSQSTMAQILQWCRENGTTFWEYVTIHDDPDILDYLAEIWKVMKGAVKRGLESEGVIPGGLKLPRKAASFHIKAKGFQGTMQRRSIAFSYALAVAEENASGGLIVTAPTCGSCGVLPGVMYLNQKHYEFSDKQIIRALATAGLIGNIVKTNASISGAEVGCQGEIGTACAMASAAAVQLFGGSVAQIEYAASMGMEHFLGLTCDPINGLVQIPCIERNAFAAGRAIDANMYALLSDGYHLVSFDTVVEAMKRTGHDLPRLYKETAEGGLAKIFQN